MSAQRTLACAGALLLLASCRSLPNEVRDGRYVEPGGRWSVAQTPDPRRPDGFARGRREGELSEFTGGSVYLPVWGVVVDERPRAGDAAELAWVADEACERVARVFADGADLELVHASRREVAGAPAELRVYATPAEPPRGGDEDDLFREERHPELVHALVAVERGGALAVFRFTDRPRRDADRFRPSQRMTLAPRWEEFLAWIGSFRLEPAEPDARGTLE